IKESTGVSRPPVGVGHLRPGSEPARLRGQNTLATARLTWRKARMKHLIVCREYPPAPYPPGGIGTYVKHISSLLAEAGESVHVIAQRWEGASSAVTESHDGRLVVHRISPNGAMSSSSQDINRNSLIIEGLTKGDSPSQAFSWQVAGFAEQL